MSDLNYKTLRKTQEKKELLDFGLGNDFLDMTPKAQVSKSKNKTTATTSDKLSVSCSVSQPIICFCLF